MDDHHEHEERFNVVQFFPDGSYEYTRRNTTMAEAMSAFRHYCNSVGARLGMTVRVIITDMGDCTCAEWEYGKGLTFPKMEGEMPNAN